MPIGRITTTTVRAGATAARRAAALATSTGLHEWTCTIGHIESGKKGTYGPLRGTLGLNSMNERVGHSQGFSVPSLVVMADGPGKVDGVSR
jgi:hypothetical protein